MWSLSHNPLSELLLLFIFCLNTIFSVLFLIGFLCVRGMCLSICFVGFFDFLGGGTLAVSYSFWSNLVCIPIESKESVSI